MNGRVLWQTACEIGPKGTFARKPDRSDNEER